MASERDRERCVGAVLLLLSAAWLFAGCMGARAEPSAGRGAVCKDTYAYVGLPDMFCGERIYDNDGHATVFVATRGADRRLHLTCSGTVIGHNRVLTAAHCFSSCPPPCHTVVGFGSKFGVSAPMAEVRSVVIYPAALSEGLRGNDFALLILAEHDVLQGARQAARILLARSFVQQRPPKLTVTGYGISSTVDRSQLGTSYFANLSVDSYACVEVRASLRDCRSFQEFTLVDRREGRPPADTCNGDSGGPAMIPDRIPRILVGVTSRGLAGPSDCGEGGIYGLAGQIPVLEWLAELVPDLRVVTEWKGSQDAVGSKQ